MMPSTALLTDRYELTMLQAALADGTADRRCIFEVFTRRLLLDNEDIRRFTTNVVMARDKVSLVVPV